MFKKAKASGFEMLGLRAQAERYLYSFQSLRKWWFVLIPYLIWRGRKTYRSEMQKIAKEAQKAAVKNLEHVRKEAQKRQKELDKVSSINREIQLKQKQGRK